MVDGLDNLNKYCITSLNTIICKEQIIHILVYIYTSNPFCCAEQLLMFNEPDMKSFWTSIIRNMLMGLIICNTNKEAICTSHILCEDRSN